MNTFKYKYVEYNIWDIFRPKKIVVYQKFKFNWAFYVFIYKIWRMLHVGLMEDEAGRFGRAKSQRSCVPYLAYNEELSKFISRGII